MAHLKAEIKKWYMVYIKAQNPRLEGGDDGTIEAAIENVNSKRKTRLHTLETGLKAVIC